eukprot:TRINITY_DN20023_c0_g4_i2.p1 TRINITY_DN20023_c0_g4~~TRINITY_DN20023_c0_g4_i2.p1  ORF type:complete len:641 (+),score=183.64 TRINITY_DN20023_c0_g4_i2:62-1984(+)
MSAEAKSFCVIGAGPSGLVAARHLLAQGHAVSVYEAGPCIGGTFANKRYDAVWDDPGNGGMRLVSSKTLTAFSDYRMHGTHGGVDWSRKVGDHPRVTEYLTYLRQYADAFHVTPTIEFGTKVVSVDAAVGEAQPYRVVLASPDGSQRAVHFDGVAVCSGLHNVPTMPGDADIPGLAAFRADPRNDVFHSSAYKEKAVFAGRKVLILGCGETAMDLAHRAAVGGAAKVGLVSRHGFLSIPHELGDKRPLDVFITNFLEHAHEHPLAHDWQLRWRMSTWVIRAGLLLVGGSSWGMNQWACRVKTVARGYHIINKSHGAIPHINAYAKPRWLAKYRAAWNLPMWLWTKFWIFAHRHLATDEKDVLPIQTFGDGEGRGLLEIKKEAGGGFTAVLADEDGAEASFDDVDTVVFATGYKQEFPFLKAYAPPARARPGYRHAAGEAPLPPHHFVLDPSDPHLGFIGFVRPNVGAIPPISELQVLWWIQQMEKARKQQPLPSAPPPSYMLNGAKYQYGVDYGNYMFRLAEEIDAAPDLWKVARAILRGEGVEAAGVIERATLAAKFLFTCCLGQAHAPLFRLRGPFATTACLDITLRELWEAATAKRGVPENIALTVMTMWFVGVNAVCYVCDHIPCFGKRRGFVAYA